jgi:ubiquinone/menaquinone biosynthesis C-methylase UbiE
MLFKIESLITSKPHGDGIGTGEASSPIGPRPAGFAHEQKTFFEANASMTKPRSFDGLLEEILPPPDHPLYAQSKRYNLEAERRGERIAAVLCLPREIPGMKVLDIGCGTGGVSVAFARRGGSVFALEPNDTHPLLMALTVARARKAGVYLNPVIARGEAIPFAARSFDIVVLNDVLEHVQSPEVVMREAARVLGRGGLIYISTPNKYSFRQIVREGHSGLFGVTLLPPRWAAFYATRVRKVTDRYTVNRIHSYGTVKKYLVDLGLDFVLVNRFRPRRHFYRDHPACPKRYRSGLVGILVRMCRLPVMREIASFVATRPNMQPGFLEFVASNDVIPPAIEEMYRLGSAPGQMELELASEPREGKAST